MNGVLPIRWSDKFWKSKVKFKKGNNLFPFFGCIDVDETLSGKMSLFIGPYDRALFLKEIPI